MGTVDPVRNASSITAYMFGGFRLLVDGQEVPDPAWRRKKARQLFKYLLSRPNHRLLKEEALELFWPESDPTAGSTNFRSTLHALRQALEPHGRAAEAGLIVGDRDTIALQPGLDIWVDVDVFERLALDAQRTGRPLAALEEACALYTGEYLPEDIYEDWTVQRRESLRRTWVELELQLAQMHVQRGEPHAAVPELQRLLRADPSDERAAHELMRVLIQLGRRSEVARVYHALEVALREELGVEPSESTRDLYHQVERQEISAASQPRRVFRCAYAFPEPTQLIGREAELERLQRVVDAGRVAGQAILLSAPAGTGKSALVGSVLRSARDAGVLCLAGAAYDERTGVPLAAFQEALTDYVLSAASSPLDTDVAGAATEVIAAVRDLRRSLATTGAAEGSTTRSMGGSDDRSRLFGAVLSLLRKLAERSAVLLCLEDLHVADAASLSLLHYLLRQLRHTPVTVIATLRSEGLQPGEPLSVFVAAVERERLAEQLQLAPLSQTATERLIASLVGASVHGNLSASVYTATEGNPLFVEQLVFALREEGRLDHPAAVWQSAVVDASSLPRVIRAVITERLARLSDRAGETLQLAAVLGHTFEYTDLLAVVEPAEEAMLLVDLDEAIRAQIIRERPTGYAFSHSLLRDGVYWALSRTRRMLLHGRAGDVLERLAGDSAMDMAAELAYHFSRAGQTAPIRRKALNYSLRAGRAAAALASHREALQHFDVACSLMEDPALGADTEMRVAGLEGRGLAQGQQGMWQGCIASYRQVLDLVSDPRARAEARQSISFALHHTVDIVGARLEAEAGLAELSGVEDRPDVAVVRLELQHQLGFLWFLEGRFRDVLQLGTEMVPLAERLGEPRWLAWAHSVVGWGYMGAGRVPEALRHYELAVEAADRGGNKLDMADYRTNLGAQNYRGGRFAAAHEHLERAIIIYREAASDLRSVYALQLLGWVSIAEGNLNRAQEHAERAGALATEANDRWQADCLELNGALESLRGDWRSAQASLEQVLKMRQQVGHPAGIVDAFVALGEVAEACEEVDAAAQAYREAVAISNSMEPGPGVVAAHRQLGLNLLRSGDAVDGAASIAHAAELAEGMPESLEYAPTLLAQAELELRRGDAEAGLGFVQRVFDVPRTAIVGIEADALQAELLSAVGRRIEAQRAAHTALRAAEQLGAPALLRMAQRAASKAGVVGGNGQAAVTRHPRPAPADR